MLYADIYTDRQTERATDRQVNETGRETNAEGERGRGTISATVPKSHQSMEREILVGVRAAL